MNKPIFNKDLSNNEISIEKTFKCTKSELWNYFTDWKLLEKWWWPKTFPATTKSIDFKVWWKWHYYMTWPDGSKFWWIVDYLEINNWNSFLAIDAFSDETGEKSTILPSTKWFIEFIEDGENSKIKIKLTYDKPEDMKQIIEMWFEEWFTDALDNLDNLL